MFDISETIIAKSDQLNADDLVEGPRTFTISAVSRGDAEQPLHVHLGEFPQPFKPSKTVRRILVAAWGKDAEQYVGRSITLYREASVKWAGQEVGGIRVSGMSHITKPLKLALQETKGGKKATHVIEPIKEVAPDPTAARIAALRAEWSTATPERQAEIVAEVARLSTPAEQAAGEESARGVEG